MMPKHEPVRSLVDWENDPAVKLQDLLEGDPVIFESSGSYTVAFEMEERVIWIQNNTTLSTEVMNLLWANANAKHLYDRWWEHRKQHKKRKVCK
jgi:hypothetical protein